MSGADVLAGRRDWWVEEAHVLDGLRRLPDGAVSCIVTSIPYWGLRAYGTEPQIWGGNPECQHEWFSAEYRPKRDGGHQFVEGGLAKLPALQGQAYSAPSMFCSLCKAWRGELGSEPTIGLFVQHIVDVFRELKRVLHPAGTCWLNVGDSYAGSGRGPTGHNGIGDQERRQGFTGSRLESRHQQVEPFSGVRCEPSTKPKDLCLIPERLALALQDDGWWVRSRIAWCKTSAMPESVQDRPTSAWEHIWLLTRSAKYFYDAEAVRSEGKGDWQTQTPSGWQNGAGAHDIVPQGRYEKRYSDTLTPSGANLRNYWLLGPEPFPEAHFATFVTELPRRCIAAGSSQAGICPECGNPWKRILEPTASPLLARGRQRVAERVAGPIDKVLIGKSFTDGTPSFTPATVTKGWEPTCRCGSEPIPSLVLDPFSGAGTTVLVATRLGRRGLGLELNPNYVAMSRRRIEQDAPLLNSEAVMTMKAALVTPTLFTAPGDPGRGLAGAGEGENDG